MVRFYLFLGFLYMSWHLALKSGIITTSCSIDLLVICNIIYTLNL